MAVAAAMTGPAASQAAGQPVVGVGDQEVSTLYDPLFRWTGVGTVRLIVPWDVALADPGSMDPWIDAARRMYVEPHIASQHRRGEDGRGHLPTPGEYRAAFAAFRARWP